MSRKNLVIIFGLICAFNLDAQIPQDTILYEGLSLLKPPKYVMYDGIHYTWEWNKKQKKNLLYKDSILLSVSPSILIEANFYYDKQKNKLHTKYSHDHYIFDFEKDTLIISTFSYGEDAENFSISNNKLYYSKCASLYIRNLETGEIIDSVNIKAIADKEFYCISRIINFPNTNEILIETGDVYYSDEITNIQYYIYNEANKKLDESVNNDIIKKNTEYQSINFYDIDKNYVFWSESIMSSSGNIFSKKLSQHYGSIYGFVIANQEIKQFIRYSNLDSEDGKTEGNDVLIPFIPNPFREKAIYEIYENIELKAEDLKQLDTFDLRILRNMVFAKHNYAFKSKFLQAYFNLYGFYGYDDKQKSRVTDVSKMLTPADKKNLELIRKISKQN